MVGKGKEKLHHLLLWEKKLLRKVFNSFNFILKWKQTPDPPTRLTPIKNIPLGAALRRDHLCKIDFNRS
jgi:hypothetical protein